MLLVLGQCTYETLELALKKYDLQKRLERFIPFVGWLASSVFYSCEESVSYASKGPAQFVNDLADMAFQPAKKMTDEEVSKAVREIRKMIDYESSRGNTIKYLGGLGRILRRLRIRP